MFVSLLSYFTKKCLIKLTYTPLLSLILTAPSVQSEEDTGAVGIAHNNKKNIEAKFAILLTNVCNKLKAKTISVEDLQMFLTSIFPQGEYISKSSSIHEIFEGITRQKLWNYWNYYPLDKTAQGFAPDEEMKSWIETYKQDLKSYKVTTKLIDHIATVDSDSSDEALSEEHLSKTDYKKLSFKLKIKFTDHTLMYIDDLWNEFAELYGLPPYVALLDRVSKGCISIVWLIPSYLAHKILSAAPHSGAFYHKREITRVELDGQCIYQEGEEHIQVHYLIIVSWQCVSIENNFCSECSLFKNLIIFLVDPSP